MRPSANGGDDRRGQVIHPGSYGIGVVRRAGGWGTSESLVAAARRREDRIRVGAVEAQSGAARVVAVIIFLDSVVYASPTCARIRGRRAR